MTVRSPEKSGVVARVGNAVFGSCICRRSNLFGKITMADNTVNEGEGNKSAARSYNQAQRRFVESGKVNEKAQEEKKALDGPEA
jgi:hypothetical protein